MCYCLSLQGGSFFSSTVLLVAAVLVFLMRCFKSVYCFLTRKITFPMISIYNLNVKSALYASVLADAHKISVVMYTVTGQKEKDKSCVSRNCSSSFLKRPWGVSSETFLSHSTVCL